MKKIDDMTGEGGAGSVTGPMKKTAADILVQCLKIQGADRVFAVPGESYLAVLDALHDVEEDIKLITCRHESGASNMADAYGKLTGRPGICFVTRGPGATNASIGVHTAFQDSTPMILFIGQVASDQVDREAFQEIDYRRMFGEMAKWVAQIDDPSRMAEYISRAYRVAISGRKGPVVLALPEDMLTQMVEQDLSAIRKVEMMEIAPTPDSMVELNDHLKLAEKPFVILGGSGWSDAARKNIEDWAATNHLPVGTAFRNKDRFDNTHPNYAGDVGIGINPELAQKVRDSDLIIAIGPRLGEITTSGYKLLTPPVPKQKLIHVHPGAEELGRVYQPALAINATMFAFSAALRAHRIEDASQRWENWRAACRAGYEAYTSEVTVPGPVNLWEIYNWLDKNLPEDAIITNGAGNYSGWAHRFYHFKSYPAQLAPTSGAMGYGVPAAVGASALYPDRTVIGLAGDGCFLMTGQELATAVQHDLPVILIVMNNSCYGTIRMHQERDYPTRISGTTLKNPDFAAYARAFGALGYTVEKTEDFYPAIEDALKAKKPALIEIRYDTDVIAPGKSLAAIRETALKK